MSEQDEGAAALQRLTELQERLGLYDEPESANEALPEPAGVIVVGTQALHAFTADQMIAHAAPLIAEITRLKTAHAIAVELGATYAARLDVLKAELLAAREDAERS